MSVLPESINWTPPPLPEHIAHGDMPGDKVQMGEGHIAKANVIFPALLDKIAPIFEENSNARVVVAVCGGSGVGKSEIASLLAYYFKERGTGSYTLSGDNYPHRIPKYNDAERLRVFRESGIRGMIQDGVYTAERAEKLRRLQLCGDDANAAQTAENPWLESYIKAGRTGLEDYLGTPNEIDFEELSDIIAQFKSGAESIWLRRMGREDSELWYEKVGFLGVNVLIIEWTHANSDFLRGVDVPVFLYSSPEETLAHRRQRNRDGNADSAFTGLVLEIEQEKLKSQARKAGIIVSKTGSLMDHNTFLEIAE